MTKTSPHISVIIPCYNAETWIAKGIMSVLDQAYPAKDVIVVDDGSTDGSVAAVAALEGIKTGAITLETGPNHGACHARNQGHAIAKARGADYVIFHDADDYFEGEILAGAVAVAQKHQADMVLSNMHLEYANGQREMRYRYEGQVMPETFFHGWMSGDYINPPGILWRTDFVSEIGGWDESLARAQDLDITLRALMHNPVVWKNDHGAAIYTLLNPNSIARNHSLKALDSRFRAVSGLIERARGTSFAQTIPLLCQEIYYIARDAFKSGESELGRRALKFIRNEGYRGHSGTKMHRLVAGIMGLENKVRLWGG